MRQNLEIKNEINFQKKMKTGHSFTYITNFTILFFVLVEDKNLQKTFIHFFMMWECWIKKKKTLVVYLKKKRIERLLL